MTLYEDTGTMLDGMDMDDLGEAIREVIAHAERSGVYMPAVVTLLRLEADELHDRFPDDVNA